MRFCSHREEGLDTGDGILLGDRALVCAIGRHGKIRSNSVVAEANPVLLQVLQLEGCSRTPLLSEALLKFSTDIYRIVPVWFCASVPRLFK